MTAPAEPNRLSPQNPAASGSIPQHAAEALTGGSAQAHILLAGQVYTLRITRSGKLILTK